MAVDQIARMMAMDVAESGGDSYTKAQTDALLDGKANLVDGKIPAAELPSYVDDVVEYASIAAFPATGESGKIYIATDTNKTYRWSGSGYVEISESLALGETASTAYAGNKGKANADAIAAIKDGTNIDSFADVETALANIPQVTVDQTYDSTSANAQSGVAVAGAVIGKVDKVTGKGLSTNDFTNEEKAKLSGIESGAEANVQPNWTQTDDTADDYIKNKPTIPAAQVNADWTAASGVAQILNKPTIPTVDQTYDATSENAQSGTAVAQALGTIPSVTVDQTYDATSVNPQSGAAVAQAVSCKISAADYATQTTGGTIKAWTTTDGSDTVLHLATQ